MDGQNVCPPRAGTWDNTRVRSGIGPACHFFAEWLCQAVSTWKPELICVEAPAMGGTGRGIIMSTETAELLIGCAVMSAVCAHNYGIRYERAHVATVRKHFLGNGRPENPKKAVMERCRILGWDVANHDAADGAAVWAWGKATFDPGFRLEQATPLFGDREGAARRRAAEEKKLREVF